MFSAKTLIVMEAAIAAHNRPLKSFLNINVLSFRVILRLQLGLKTIFPYDIIIKSFAGRCNINLVEKYANYAYIPMEFKRDC